ncbi:MAG TPA: DUF1203 domain-containing protein [Cytophagales bacterium]|nr:DUF1203 domain-containing protein [Cytophagales bacterium]
MAKFKIVPLSKAFAKKIRETRQDDFDNEVIEEVATGLGPCRVSLKPFKKGEDKRLVLSHSPFELKNPFNQPGPIFISANEVEEYADVYKFPQEIKNNKKSFLITLIGYNKEQWMIHNHLVSENEDIDEVISEIFDNFPEVDYLHARSAKACCYICKIIRSHPGK